MTKDLEKRIKELEKDNTRLQTQVYSLSKGKQLHMHDFYGKHVRIGILSDTHYGSLYCNKGLVEELYKIFKKEGISQVYHSGDIVDGQGNYRGQEYEQYAVGFDNQLEDVIKNYPTASGITTYFIEGNHSFKKMCGGSIAKAIADRRKDMVFLGGDLADIAFDKNSKAKLRLLHPDGGTAYALSYKSQKIVESLDRGTKPNILSVGHYHKAEFIPNYQNVSVLQAGTCQKQTPFMARKGSLAMQGGWILDFYIDNNGVNGISPIWLPYKGE